MKTPNDFAKAAAQVGHISLQMKPEDGDKYEQSRKLIQFHLNSAALKLRQIAEDMQK